MDRERARRAHAIFTAALEQPPEGREAYAVSACTDDDELLADVRRLLHAAASGPGFMDTAALLGVRERRTADASVPDAVGNYLVVGVLGIGGMATVYRAMQENPPREVALKVMHQGLADTDASLRFRLEAETLARLHHPGIAQIYEAGTARLGRPTPSPFFAMELVPDALPITQYARTRGLSLRQRIDMFLTVCDAVTHGHQNGVIHRDIKPANLLVGRDGRPRVIDFGIARSIGPHAGVDAGITSHTAAGGLLGTLSSMSPEQCSAPHTVDVRSDVYSLGVVLYELVTDRPPYDLSGRSLPDAVRAIVDEQPQRAGLHNRHARGDLEAIIGKSLQKRPADRYASVGALADDLRRFCEMRPIEARRQSSAAQVLWFARRNPALTAAIMAAAAALVIGATVSARMAVLAGRARDQTLQRAEELELVTGFQESMLRELDAPAIGEAMRKDLLVRLANPGDAAQGSDGSATPIEQINFTSVAIASLRDTMLTRYRQSIDTQFADRPELRSRLLINLAAAMRNIGLHNDAEGLVSEAVALRTKALGPEAPATLSARHTHADLLQSLGRLEQALAVIRDAHERASHRLGKDDPLTLAMGSTFASILRRSGEFSAARVLYTDVLARQRRVLGDDHVETQRTLNNLGVVCAQTGDLPEAERHMRELLERRRRLFGPASPEYRGTLGNLGVLLQDQGRLAEALELIEQAVAADRRQHGDSHPSTLVSVMQLAGVLADMGEWKRAAEVQRQCVAGRLASLGPENIDTLRATAFLASLLHRTGDLPEARSLIESALSAQRRVLGDDHVDTLTAMSTAAVIAQAAGLPQQAEALSLEALQRVRNRFGQNGVILGRTLWHRGLVQSAAAADRQGALQAAETLLEAHRLLTATSGPDHPYVRQAAESLAEHYRLAQARWPDDHHARQAAAWQARAAGPVGDPVSATPAPAR